MSHALDLLHGAAQVEKTFEEYSGHLLLAFYLIGTTSRSRAIADRALAIGRRLGRGWKTRWRMQPPTLDADTILLEVLASFAAHRLGIAHPSIRKTLRAFVSRYAPRDLIYFDPATEAVPRDVPEDCRCGQGHDRGAVRCRRCGASLQPRSPYDVWYYALTNAYFCEQDRVSLGAGFNDVMRRLPELKPYPGPESPHYYSAIYAVTHIVYTLNDYGRTRLPARMLRDELEFLKRSMAWALDHGEPDTIGEIIDSLRALGLGDRHPLLVRGRRFILDSQRADGTWGDEADAYGYFHTLWTVIDGLRDFGRRPVRQLDAEPGRSPSASARVSSIGRRAD